MVIQSDRLSVDSVLVALFTTTIVDAPLYRLSIAPTEANGLVEPSQIMADKIVALPKDKCGDVIGRLADDEIAALNAMLAVVVGIADPVGVKPPSRRKKYERPRAAPKG